MTINGVGERDNGTWICNISVKDGEDEIGRKVVTIELNIEGIISSNRQIITAVVTISLGAIILLVITMVPRQGSKIARISKPKVSEIFQDGAELLWTHLEPNAGKASSYIVSYRSEMDPPGQLNMLNASETKVRVEGMLPNIRYVFKVCAQYKGTRGPDSEESDPVIITKPQIPDKVIGKPYASQVTHNSVALTWESYEDRTVDDNDYTVTISYRTLDENNWKEQSVANTNVNYASVVELKPQTKYIFKVLLDSTSREQRVSEISDPILTKEDETKREKSLAIILKSLSERISSDGVYPEIYCPKMMKLHDNVTKCIITINTTKSMDDFRTPVNEKVLMLVGPTGAGKSTLINGIANYVMDVQWENDFRFKVIVNEGEKSQAHSQTSKAIAYTFHNSRLPYTLTVIDTPGFGDTRGIESDKIIVDQIRALFSVGGIDQIHGVGFVTQAANVRLTHTVQYVFDSVLSMFGKDIASNIFLMITFADGQDPPVLSAIKEAEIPYKAYFKFSNSALFSKDINRLFWDLGMESFDQFFREFETVEPHSLQLTRENLNERQHLEAVIEGLKMQIRVVLAKVDVLRQKQYILRKREAEILQNQHFTYELTVSKQRRIEVPKNVFITNCCRCEFTCHYPCPISEDSEKYRCKAMDGGGKESACCTVCPGNCPWDQHVNASHRFETYYEVETQTSDDLKKNMFDAIEGKNQVESMIIDIENELKMFQNVIIGMVSEAKRSLERLQEIALKPDPLSETEYIDLLVKAENSKKSPGFTERIKVFEVIKEIVEKNQGAIASGKKTDSIWWKNILSRK